MAFVSFTSNIVSVSPYLRMIILPLATCLGSNRSTATRAILVIDLAIVISFDVKQIGRALSQPSQWLPTLGAIRSGSLLSVALYPLAPRNYDDFLQLPNFLQFFITCFHFVFTFAIRFRKSANKNEANTLTCIGFHSKNL